MMQLRTVAVIALAAILFTATFPAEMAPYAWGVEPKGGYQPHDPSDMQASADWLDDTLEPGESVFTVFGEYHSLSEHYPPYSPRIYHLVSPQHGQIEGLNHTSRHDMIRAAFIEDLQTGGLAVLIMTRRTAYIMERWPDARQAFQRNYCRVLPRPAVYERYNVHVYEYAPGQDECVNTTVFWN